MKKFIAKEFLWLLIALVLAVPIAFLWLAGLDIVSAEQTFSEDEKVFVIELFLLAYAFGVVGVYLVRFVIGAIKTLSAPPPEG